MELFSKKAFLDLTKRGFLQNHALSDSHIGTAMLLSVAIHALLLSTNTNNDVRPRNLAMKISGFDTHIKTDAKQSHTSENQQQKGSELIALDVNPLSEFDRLERTETFEQQAFVTVSQQNKTDGEEMQVPIKGLSVGGVAFTGFGGGRKRAFELVNSHDESLARNTNGDLQEIILRRQMAQVFLAQFKNDLNELIPIDAGQKCQLQTAVVCQKSNDVLEKYLLLKMPSIQQLVAGKMVRIASDDGQWKLELSN